MSVRQELIAKALRKRFVEVSERIEQLSPHQFGEHENFVAAARERFADASPEKVPMVPLASGGWMMAPTDALASRASENCLSSLASLALGEPLSPEPFESPPLSSLLQDLINARSDAEASAQLLLQRYEWPLNFSQASEAPVREYLLMRLMVQWRKAWRRESFAPKKGEVLLLHLNLLAVNASLDTDLRFLDALNYYYELSSTFRQPHVELNWLLVSYFALYAQVLAASLLRT